VTFDQKQRNLPPWLGRFLFVVPGPSWSRALRRMFVTDTVATRASGELFATHPTEKRSYFFFFVVLFFLVVFFVAFLA
jgi:hypothetical protein